MLGLLTSLLGFGHAKPNVLDWGKRGEGQQVPGNDGKTLTPGTQSLPGTSKDLGHLCSPAAPALVELLGTFYVL